MDSDRWEFYEENFQQGRRDLLHQIHRRKPSAPPAGQVARTAIEVYLGIMMAVLLALPQHVCLWFPGQGLGSGYAADCCIGKLLNQLRIVQTLCAHHMVTRFARTALKDMCCIVDEERGAAQ